jgi:hypothetical protein
MRRWRLPEAEGARAREARGEPEPALPLVLQLQHGAGNAAVTRMLQRQSRGQEMLEEARAREEELAGDEDDDAAWELPPLEDEPEPELEAEPEREPEPLEPEPLEPEPLPAFDALGGADLRGFATGMPQEEAEDEAAREAAARGAFPRPDAGQEIGDAKPLGWLRQPRLKKAVGHHAAHMGPGADPGALAAGLQQGRKDERARTEAKRAERDKAREQRESKKKLYEGTKKSRDVDPESLKKARAASELAHEQLIRRDQLELAYRPIREEGRALKARIEAESEIVTRALPRGTASEVERLVHAEPTDKLDGPRKTLEEAGRALATAKQAESEYRAVREKAQRILDRIDAAAPAFKDRVKPASRETAERYATGPALATKLHKDAHIELNKANDDVAARERDWELASRGHDKLAQLKGRRTALGFKDDDADAVIATADNHDAAGDFWRLQESVKPVEAAVKRLEELEAAFQKLDARLKYVRVQLAGTLDPAHDHTLATGFANRKAGDDPARRFAQLDQLMRTVERPVAENEFDVPRKAGSYATATAALGPLEANGVIRRGDLNSVYVSSWDGEGYSVEFLVDGLPDIVIHVHCTKDGNPKDGANTAHWKPKSVKYAPGVSHAISPAVRDKLIDRDLVRAQKDVDKRRT